MAGNRTLKLSILADVDNLKKNLDSGSKEVQTFGDKLSNFGKMAGAAFAAAGVAAVGFAGKLAVDAVKAASDLSETISKTKVIFGDSAKQVEAFAETAAKSLGQTKQQALDAAANFAIFGKSAGLAGDDLVKFSTDFTGLASDLASFNNTSPEEAINAIGSALRGEAEPLRRYGVLLDDASLRQAALELGIISTTKNALTPQQKVLAAQQLIYKQTGAAQGDFARTSDGLANQQRILTAQLENVKTTIGTALLPIVLEITTFFSKYMLPIIEKIGAAFSGDDETSLNTSMNTIVENIKSFVIPIFEGLKSIFDKVKKAIDDNSEGYASLLKFFKAVYEFTAKFLAPVLGTTLKIALQAVGTVVATLISAFGKFLSIVTSVFNKIMDIVNLIKNNPLIKGIGNLIGSIGGSSVPTPSVAPSRAGSATVNNITVNGAIDSEGTARAIVNALNQSMYRGTGGAGVLVG